MAKVKNRKKKVSRKKKISGIQRIPSKPISKDLDQLDYSDVQKIQSALSGCRVFWELERLIEWIDSPNYKLNKWEQQALDDMFEKYKTKYKSKLAETLK